MNTDNLTNVIIGGEIQNIPNVVEDKQCPVDKLAPFEESDKFWFCSEDTFTDDTLSVGIDIEQWKNSHPDVPYIKASAIDMSDDAKNVTPKDFNNNEH